VEPGMSASETRGRLCHIGGADPDGAALNPGYSRYDGCRPEPRDGP
jgi:hypothetical protein